MIELHDAPKLLVEWSPRWEEFVSSIGPAFARSQARLAGEAPFGILPYRPLIAALLLELLLLFAVIAVPRQINQLRPYAPPKLEPYQVIYYSGNELPRTQDLGGARAGAMGRAGGREAHHPTQTIHVARGGSLLSKVVDAPDIKLPSSLDAVANLLALKSNPAPLPAEGLHSDLKAPSLPANVIAPAPLNVTADQLRGALGVDSVIPPAPRLRSEGRRRRAASLNPNVIAPAPGVSRDNTRTASSLNPNVIAPPSARVSRDRSRSAASLTTSVVPPAPAAFGHEVSPSRVRMNDAAVVPPPASAPERESSRTAKLTLPAPSVIAPPPSPDSTQNLRRLESGGVGGSSPAVVPPPPTPTGSGSFLSSIVGKLFGAQDVVPPPPSVSSGGGAGTARNAAGGPGGSLANVVPPPPSMGGSGGSNSGGSDSGRSQGSRSQGSSLDSNVIPPPPSVAGSGTRGSPNGTANGTGSGNGTLMSGNVVPPPPSVGSGAGLSGSGRQGAGLGGPGDVGSVLAPPKGAGGSSSGSGVVISSEPGSEVGVPGNGGKGSLAMSPAGGDTPGLGGSGGGASIGHGEGSGSGLTGDKSAVGPGAGKAGTGYSSDANARDGISTTPGPGGAGTAPTGASAVPGVDVRGGSTSNVVTLPSFGSGGASEPSLPGRSSVKGQQGPDITIVATSRSGGAFDFYGKLAGDNYTVYVDTVIGTVVMQFAEANSARRQAGSLVGPQGLRTPLPRDLPRARVVIKCRLDASGNVSNLQVLEAGPAAMTAKIMAALPSWKFRPAMRGTEPVEVNAILGFNIDTNDRN